MKKRFINRLAAFILFAMMGANLFSQGFYVYTKDGQCQDYASENVDSIVFYEKAADIGGNFINGHEYVDLGLPSGLKWATCNVGASKPEDYGGYYAWGETEEKNDYSRDTYKYYDSSIGYVDIGSNISGTQYDVAHVKWGSSWRMPTLDEIKELVDNCTWEWTTYNGVEGRLVTGPNGNSIFLPAAGYRYVTDFYDRGSYGRYWSAASIEGGSDYACVLDFFSGYSNWYGWYDRRNGFTVRPVTDAVENPDDENEEDEPIQEPEEEEEITPEKPADTMEAIDLGLSVKWATCNVGASKPEDYGDYYAWGETKTKSDYGWETYKWCEGTDDTMTKYCTNSDYGTVDNRTTLTSSDDVATVKWGSKWRMPTKEEMIELDEDCTWTWTTQNGVDGMKVTGPNGNSIFLPAAGYRDGTDVYSRSSFGLYWSATLDEYGSRDACGLFFGSVDSYRSIYYRYNGHTVRPVTE